MPEDRGIVPIIDIRNCWKDGEETHQYRDTNLVYDYKGTVWYIEGDGRIFTPVARNNHKWKRLYKKRTGVERINGRIDRDYQFERHTIRGLGKMTMFITVTFLIYMAMAKSKIERGQKKHLCKLYA